jgi:ParB family chromosome partitioning protein
MLQFMSNQSAAIKEAEDLRERLRSFDGASPVRAIDPGLIRPSRWANRHPSSFASADFAELRDEIESAGGNVQPIRVRPLPGTRSDDGAHYELVYGHRRHRACLELGLPVMSLVEDATDQELFEAMERENRGRKNLSAWEQGCMYRRALDDGLYPSLRKLSEALKVDVSLVSKSVALSRLPETVIEAFASPIDIQFRWAQALSEALQRDPEGLIVRARELKQAQPRPAATQVFEALIKPASASVLPAEVRSIEPQRIGGAARHGAIVSTDGKGRVVVQFEPGAVPTARRPELVALLEAFLKS